MLQAQNAQQRLSAFPGREVKRDCGIAAVLPRKERLCCPCLICPAGRVRPAFFCPLAVSPRASNFGSNSTALLCSVIPRLRDIPLALWLCRVPGPCNPRPSPLPRSPAPRFVLHSTTARQERVSPRVVSIRKSKASLLTTVWLLTGLP